MFAHSVTGSAQWSALTPSLMSSPHHHLDLRTTLLEAYGGRCAISGCAVAETLELAAITAHGPEEPSNYLVVRADLARLFQAGLIAVDAIHFVLIVAPALAQSEYMQFAGRRLHQPERTIFRPSRQALDSHARHWNLEAHAEEEADIAAIAESDPTTKEAPPAQEQSPPQTDTPVLSLADADAAAGYQLVARIRQLVKSWVNSVAYSRDGTLLATGSWDGLVRMWRSRDGALLGTLQGELGEINAVTFSPDNRLFAAAGRNRAVRIWRLSDGAPLLLLQGHDGHEGAVFAAGFNHDGNSLITGGWDATVKIWRVSDGSLRQTLHGHRGAVNSIAVSNDSMIASASHDRSVRLWDSDGALLHVLSGHSDAVFAVAFSPDGRLLASAGTDQTINLWRVRDGMPLYTLRVEHGAVFSLGFSPDGSVLAAGDHGRSVRLWRVHDGMLLAEASEHSEGVTSVAFSPDGRTLASGSFDATLRFWDVGRAA